MHLVVAPLGAPAELQHFDSFEELKTALADLLGTECHLFVIQGSHHPISVGPWHYLLTSDGERLPLFDVPTPEEAEPAESGYVGSMSGVDIDYGEEEDQHDPDAELQEETAYEEEEEEEEGVDEEEDPYGDEPDLRMHQPAT